MITTLISWIIIFYTLFSLGDILVLLYNKTCKNEENYHFLDTFILGICFACILLPLSSLWLPSNHYILFAYIAIGTIHWIVNRPRLNNYLSTLKQFLLSIKFWQAVLITIPFLAVLIYVYIFDHFYDAEYYHYQQIRWNEEYAIIPGLGNFEDRFGFNTNYLLLSSIFTFRFLFGDTEAIYSLQSLLYVCILCWITISFIRSKYNNIYIVLLALAYLIIFLMGYSLASSSTDIIPLLLTFYILSKSAIDTKWLRTQYLLALLLPVSLVTFKLSTAFLCLICIIPFFFLIKEKRYRELTFIFTSCFLVFSLWCTRNVIISGYLVYPLYYLDFFNFDWKVPKGAAILQEIHIYNFAKERFDADFFNTKNFLNGDLNKLTISSFINIIFYVVTLLSPIVVIVKYKKRSLDFYKICLYIIILFCIICGFLTAPDLRFSYGYVLGLLFFLALLFLNNSPNPIISRRTIFLTILILCGFCGTAIHKFITAGERIGVKFEHFMDFVALYHHRNAKNLNSFEEYQMGEYTVHTTKERYDNRTFDILLATDPNGIPFEYFTGLKIQDIKTIELRGKSLQDGFRTKPEFTEIINNNIEIYKLEYYKSR